MPDFITYSAAYLKDNGLISDNSDEKIIRPIIIDVQHRILHPILGTDLFTEIKEEIIAGSVSAANEYLLDNFIVHIMQWAVLCDVSPAIKYRYMNKGLMVKNSDNSAAADLSEVKFLMDQWKNKYEWYAQRLTKYLKNHTDEYPLYDQNTDCDDIRPNNTNYTSGIYLEDDDDCDCNTKIGNYE